MIISCVYRTPGFCPDTYDDKIEDIYDRNVEKKMIFVCGGCNLDLFNANEHKKTTEFFWLHCTVPRVTTNSATLIIFSQMILQLKI